MTATEGVPDGSGGAGRLPDEVVEELLADEACRRVLSCLAERGEPTAVEDLARAVAAHERDVDAETVDRETVTAYRDDLFQRHLPKLTPTGVVAYDSLVGTVALDTADDRILSALD